MNANEGFKRFREIQDEQFNLHKKKNHDYAAKEYKLSRLASFCKQGVLMVKDEKIEDTLNDIAVYAILARIIYEQSKTMQ